MRADMSFSMFKKTVPAYKFVCLAFLLLFMTGCAAAKKERTDVGPDASLPEDRRIRAIEVSRQPDAVEVYLKADGKLTYTSVKQSFPLGIAVYLPETTIDEAQVIGNFSEIESVGSITASYADDEKTTAKVEILLRANLDYGVVEEEDGLRLLLDTALKQNGKEKANVNKKTAVGSIDAQDRASEAAGESMGSAIGAMAPTDISDRPAVLTGIEFTVDGDGGSALLIKTSHQVLYDIIRGEKGHLIVQLKNTDIPAYRQRALITTYFNSAVLRIDPVQRAGDRDFSHLDIEMRQSVPYRIVQEKETLLVSFDPTTLDIPKFDAREKRLVLGIDSKPVLSEIPQETAFVPETIQEDIMDTPDQPVETGVEKSYTGEKIRLDFFETDIKNVFRILRSVSGRNFAVDRDVTGNVTLTLDNPVPWDQVLDLVLKMNGLGKVQEGSITRIATQETLKKEEEMRQASFAAKKRALEQKKSLEPLVTEYIPINYSSAETDIKPHLESILTPDRGHVSVDSRTNMIIMTDVKEKIDQAKEMIFRLDKVTPQIMIAARVVEVSKDFSKELGISWGMSGENILRDDLGGSYGYDLSMNYPVAASGSIGYTFSRITGTPFALNAMLTASETKGDVRIISSPKILTLDNKKAKIKQGIEYAYLERDDSGGSSVKFKDIDLLLEVTPHVTPDARIAMSLYITKNDIDSITDGIPSLSTNEAETELLVNDGNTIVIGGIVKTSITESSSGFPYLSDIPYLGRLFRSEGNQEKKNELLIFITPTIVQLEQKRNE